VVGGADVEGLVLAVPGFTAAQRFQVASGKSPYPMIALYEVEADEPQEIWKLTEQLAAGMIHTEALDEAAAFIIQPIGPRVEAVPVGSWGCGRRQA
jgi:hypothetical protein